MLLIKEILRGIKIKGIRKIDVIVKFMLKYSLYKNFVVSWDVFGIYEDVIEVYLLVLKMDNIFYSCLEMYNVICLGLNVFVLFFK